MSEEKPPKCKALDVKVPAIRSARVPAKPKREYRDFDDYVRAAELLDRYAAYAYDEEKQEGRWIRHETALAVYREWDAAFEHFERDDQYEQTKHKKPDLLGAHTDRVIKQRFVSEQAAIPIGSFPNANPSSPEMYLRMLVEEIIAANPRASALEATCRHIRRTATWLPTVAEFLKVLRTEMERWEERVWGESDLEHYRNRIEERKAAEEKRKAEEKAAEAKREERLRQRRIEDMRKAYDAGWYQIVGQRWATLRSALKEPSYRPPEEKVAFALGCYQAFHTLRRCGLITQMGWTVHDVPMKREQALYLASSSDQQAILRCLRRQHQRRCQRRRRRAREYDRADRERAIANEQG